MKKDELKIMTTNLSNRTDFLDRIRVSLTALVILHHTAIMFGGSGRWYLRMATSSTLEKVLFTLFASVNQAFFMGFFFLLAGYFSARSYDRKGARYFILDRLKRLGLPILFYGFILGPCTVALAKVHDHEPFFDTWGFLIKNAYFNIGPLWFAAALLIFSVIYCIVRLLVRSGKVATDFVPAHLTLLLAALVTGAGAFALRLWMPVGQELWSMQIGYFSSYVVLFLGGCAVARGRWLERIDADIARRWIIICLITIPALFAYGILSGAIHGAPFNTQGGWTLPALAYAFWEPFVAWGIILGMLWRFRVARNPSPKWQNWAPRAFTAYIIHPPVVVAMGLVFSDLAMPNSAKFLIAGICSVVLSFGLARPILAIPGTRRIL
jgi:fucose 4-O-acetylase-like acetyltransferase